MKKLAPAGHMDPVEKDRAVLYNREVPHTGCFKLRLSRGAKKTQNYTIDSYFSVTISGKEVRHEQNINC